MYKRQDEFYEIKPFFKQKTAYEMSASLVGSEMCIRDSYNGYNNYLSLIHISEPTRLRCISYAVFCLTKN
ncbi:hypothetical protein JMUB7547_28390 [Staphylococcus aureus]